MSSSSLLFILHLLSSSAAEAVPFQFVTSPGEHRLSGDTSVSVFEEDRKIQFRIKSGSRITGPTTPWIPRESAWFIFPYSLNEFWVSSGTGEIMLIELSERGTKYTTSAGVTNLLDRAPAAVKRRLDGTDEIN